LASSLAAQEQTVHIAHCRDYCPQSAYSAEREIVVHHLYAANIEPETGLAEWVAYRVLGDSLGVASLLPRSWHADPLLGEELPVDIENSGVEIIRPDLSNAQDREYRVNEVQINVADRGRLAPMTSFAGTPYWEDLNNLSNMAPLPTDLRVGSWARLEQAINALAAQVGDVYVISGPLLTVEQAINNPQAYFKLVLAGNRLAAFVFPGQLRQNDSYCAQISSLEQIEAETGLDLLPVVSRGELTIAGTLNRELGCGESE
jgi:endonuclease G